MLHEVAENGAVTSLEKNLRTVEMTKDAAEACSIRGQQIQVSEQFWAVQPGDI